MFWWYFIIGCDGKICPPCRKWYPNCDCQHQVGQNLINPSNKNWKQARVQSFFHLRNWLTLQTSMVACDNCNFQVQKCCKSEYCDDFPCASSFEDWWIWPYVLMMCPSLDVMVRSVIPLGSGTTTGVWQSEYFDVFSCVSSFEDWWLGPYVLMIFHHWMWW